MKRLVYFVRVVAVAGWAAFRALIRRARRGPTLPSWTWSEELFVAISRATAVASARDVALMSPRGQGLRPPLSRVVRAALTVERVDLLGVRAERYCPKTTPSGTILWFHGGGFVAGSVGLERRVAAARAAASNCDTYNVEDNDHPYVRRSGTLCLAQLARCARCCMRSSLRA